MCCFVVVLVWVLFCGFVCVCFFFFLFVIAVFCGLFCWVFVFVGGLLCFFVFHGGYGAWWVLWVI